MRKFLVPALSLAVVIPALAAMLVLGRGTPAAMAHGAAHQSVPLALHLHHGKNSTSSNWSGYANTGGRFTDVKGSWTQPSASCSSGQTAYSSFWVGIDGDITNTVEQTGTDADCSSGSPVYYAWYEMYPKFPVNLSKPVSPGDSMTAEVSTNGSGSFTLTISDSTKRWTFSTNQTSKKARLGSAEWIAEAPSGSGGVLPLANFGSVGFSNCTANGLSISANPNPDAITMASNGVTKAVPSGLGGGGTSFSVTWKHS
jgi:peptidase A4-like protein